MEISFWHYLWKEGGSESQLRQHIPEVGVFNGSVLEACYFSDPNRILQRRSGSDASQAAFLERLLSKRQRDDAVAILRQPASTFRSALPWEASVLTVAQVTHLLGSSKQPETWGQWSLQSLVFPFDDVRVVVAYSQDSDGKETLSIKSHRNFWAVYPLASMAMLRNDSKSDTVVGMAKAKTRSLVQHVQQLQQRQVKNLIVEFISDAPKQVVLHGFWQAIFSNCESADLGPENRTSDAKWDSLTTCSTDTGCFSLKTSLTSQASVGPLWPVDGIAARDEDNADSQREIKHTFNIHCSDCDAKANNSRCGDVESAKDKRRVRIAKIPATRARPSATQRCNLSARSPRTSFGVAGRRYIKPTPDHISEQRSAPRTATLIAKPVEHSSRTLESSRSETRLRASQLALPRHCTEGQLRTRLTSTLCRQVERFREYFPICVAQHEVLSAFRALLEQELESKQHLLDQTRSQRDAIDHAYGCKYNLLIQGLGAELERATADAQKKRNQLEQSRLLETQMADCVSQRHSTVVKAESIQMNVLQAETSLQCAEFRRDMALAEASTLRTRTLQDEYNLSQIRARRRDLENFIFRLCEGTRKWTLDYGQRKELAWFCAIAKGEAQQPAVGHNALGISLLAKVDATHDIEPMFNLSRMHALGRCPQELIFQKNRW